MEILNKDPDSIENFTVPWTRRLLTGVTISTSQFIVPSGLTVVGSATISGQDTTAKISGGTLGQIYEVENRVTTSDGQTLDYHFQIFVIEST